MSSRNEQRTALLKGEEKLGCKKNKRKPSLFLRCLSYGSILMLTSCASVDIQKVPTPTHYSRWTDEMQKKADSIKGIRYYLPRPYVNVFESFPVHSEVYIANGVISTDGQYVVIREVRNNSDLKRYFGGKLVGVEVPVSLVSVTKTTLDGPQSDKVDELDKLKKHVEDLQEKVNGKIVTGAEEDPTKKDDGKNEAPSSTTTANTGQNSRNVTNDNGAYAYQPMRGNMDIAYLPDFEEQYAVSSAAGLGNAQFSLNLGQGWSMQGLNSLTDNSQLNRRIFDLLDTATAGAADIITGGASRISSLITGAKPGDLINGGTQSGKETESLGQAGADVSIKITVVHYATKGLYPVIKPRELQERSAAIDSGNHVVIDITGAQSKPTIASHFDPQALKRAQEAVNNTLGNFTVPRYPYQYISFNTFRLLAVEAINPTVNPFGHIIPKTGTAGDPGDRQAANFSDEIINGGKKTEDRKTKREQLAKEFKENAKALTGPDAKIEVKINQAGKAIKLCAAEQGTDDDQGKVLLEAAIKDWSNLNINKSELKSQINKEIMRKKSSEFDFENDLKLDLKDECSDFDE